MASNVEIEPIEHDIEDSFDAPESNCLNNLDLPPLVILLLVLFCVLYLIVMVILENTEANKPPYKL
jgi:hypothetical protein